MARCCSVENEEELPYIVHPLKPISPQIFFHINVGTSNVPIYSRVHEKFMHDKDIAVIDRFQQDYVSTGDTISAISPIRALTQGNLRQTASYGSQVSGASTAARFFYTTDTAIRSKQLAFPNYKYCRVVRVANSNTFKRGFAPSFADRTLQDEFTSSMSRFYSTDIRQPGNQQLPLIDFWIGAKPENQHILLYQPDQEGYLCLIARLQPHIQRFIKLTRYYHDFQKDLNIILPAVPVDIYGPISLQYDNVLDSIAIANSTKKPVFFPAQASRIILFQWLWQYNDTLLSVLPWELVAYILDFVLTNKHYLEIAVQYTRRELEMYYDIRL